MSPAEEQQIIGRIRELSAGTSLDSAIERGHLLLSLNLKKSDYETKHLGLDYSTGRRFINLVRHPRMARADWIKPETWTVCDMLLDLTDRMFDLMLSKGLIGFHTTRSQIIQFRSANRFRCVESIDRTPVPHIPFSLLGKVHHGDCIELAKQIPDQTIQLLLMSPPYGKQSSISPVSDDIFHVWFADRMDAFRTKLTPTGSIIALLGTYIDDGEESDYINLTRSEMRGRGWRVPQQLYRLKTDGSPAGANDRARIVLDHILWFSLSNDPYADFKACGNLSRNVTMSPSKHHPYGRFENKKEATARITDMVQDQKMNLGHDLESVIKISNTAVDKDVDHPERFSPIFAATMIKTFTLPGDTLCDPMAGSATTLLVGRSLGRHVFGFEINAQYVELGNDRLLNDERYAS